MKSVLLNDQGYTENGKWRLAPVEPDQPMIDAARDKYMAWHYACGKEDVPLYYTPSDHFRAMIAASPAPELGEAVAVGEISIEKLGRPFNSIRVGVHFYNEVPPAGTKLFTASPAPAATDSRIAELEAENQMLRADAERYRFMRVKACIIGGEFHILNMPNAGEEWRQKYDAGDQLDAAIDAAREVKDGH